ncbi:MAG: hypothetical protein AAGD11_18140 [Planctomycetota bacterium]
MLLFALLICGVASVPQTSAIEVVLDYTLDEQNSNWFSDSPAGQARRASLDAAAAFLSAIITNDDWNSLSSLNQNISFTDIAASSLQDLDGNTVLGSPESDGEGFAYSFPTSNRSSLAANEYVIYVGAFEFDSGTSAQAKGGWSSSGSSRNAAGAAGSEFNTWGGRIYFDTGRPWYTGQNPGVDPTDDYGVQDPNKTPTTDIQSDNWDWSTSSNTWKGFDLRSIDSSASGMADLYGVGLHEIMHALGTTSSNISSFANVANGFANGANVVAEFGGPVPLSSTGGHFDSNVQGTVWDSDGIISEALLDPNSTSGDRKYLTRLDAALLRDLGYDVLSTLASEPLSPADFDEDGDVDGNDLATWTGGYGIDSTGDADEDGETSGSDLLIWQREFQQQVAGSLALAVPEPSSTTLCLLLLVGAVGNHRRVRSIEVSVPNRRQ